MATIYHLAIVLHCERYQPKQPVWNINRNENSFYLCETNHSKFMRIMQFNAQCSVCFSFTFNRQVKRTIDTTFKELVVSSIKNCQPGSKRWISFASITSWPLRIKSTANFRCSARLTANGKCGVHAQFRRIVVDGHFIGIVNTRRNRSFLRRLHTKIRTKNGKKWHSNLSRWRWHWKQSRICNSSSCTQISSFQQNTI